MDKRIINPVSTDATRDLEKIAAYPIDSSFKTRCHLYGNPICPHPDCNGYERPANCGVWKTSSTK